MENFTNFSVNRNVKFDMLAGIGYDQMISSDEIGAEDRRHARHSVRYHPPHIEPRTSNIRTRPKYVRTVVTYWASNFIKNSGVVGSGRRGGLRTWAAA